MPRSALLAANIDPDRDFRQVAFSGTHDATIAAVAGGKVQAGALNISVWQKFVDEKKVDTSQVKVFYTTPPFHDYNWTVRSDLDPTAAGEDPRRVPRARSVRSAAEGDPRPAACVALRADDEGELRCDRGGRPERRPDPVTGVADAAASAPAFDFRARSLRVRHPGTAVDVLHDVDLDVRHGERIAIVGASGAGKSTLLAALALAREPAAGTLEVFGTTPWSLSSAARHRLRRRLFLAPQLPPLPPRQRVVDAVLAGRLPYWSIAMAIASLAWPREADVARAALARFSLADKLFDRVDRLSGGERQRVALARLVVADADALLVDEPLSALDPTLAEQALDRLIDEATTRGATLVCSLHQVELAHARFPRLVGLRQGRVLFDLPRERVDAPMLAALYAGDSDPGDSHPDPVPLTDAEDDDLPLRLADGSRL